MHEAVKHRADWWRFWWASRAAPAITKKSVSLTVVAGGRETTIGYRRRGWKE